MTQEQIQQLETELWDAADQLRASSKLTAAEYKVEAVKQIIKTEKEWKAKLEREIFSDANIQKAITWLPTLFQYE